MRLSVSVGFVIQIYRQQIQHVEKLGRGGAISGIAMIIELQEKARLPSNSTQVYGFTGEESGRLA